MAINTLSFKYQILDSDDVPTLQDGVIVHGIWIEGASWNGSKNSLSVAKPGELFSRLPHIHFEPTAELVDAREKYTCPVYKTTVRAGELSTTGLSTNFVVAIHLPSEKSAAYWVLQGTAGLLNLSF